MARTPNTKRPTPQTKPGDYAAFHTALSRWYKTHGRRDLPWRNTDDAYAIWVSEVMLQQTQVATVLNKYYAPFLKKFPTITHLAKASRQEVLKAWEGLGYYRRAGFLHEAAKQVVSGGWWVVRGGNRKIPLTTHYALLTSLPGIGRNTAHAILAFAHHAPVPVLEANVKRVVSRIFAISTPKENELWDHAYVLLGESPLSEPSSRSGRAQGGSVAALHNRTEHGRDKEIGQRKAFVFDYNQAMMDLGALVCTPKAPDCPSCPANTICKGQTNPEAYPQKKAKKAVPTRKVAILVTEDAAGRLYLEARTDALLGGLYGFPQAPAAKGRKLGEVSHTYSHFKLEGTVRYSRLTSVKRGPDWHTRGEIAALPLSRLDHKVLALVDKGRGKAA